MTLKQKLATGIATGAVLANALLPLAFAEDITVSGNGDNSNNLVTSDQTNTTTVTQNNTANIDNNVSISANTGNNEANRNTGGDVSIDTGNAAATVTVSNAANVNSANVGCCSNGDTNVTISGNGANSHNTVNFDQDNTTTIRQRNNADFDNNVDLWLNTGDNEANRNTGGNVSIMTGDASATVDVSNAANWNSATVGGDGKGGTLSLWITGNGAGSNNLIDADNLDNNTYVTQRNRADFDNNVDVNANTGDNEANRNTGGIDGSDVTIDTGDADVDVTIDNMANFNEANVDCGCTLAEDTNIKINGNGAGSFNTIRFDNDSTQTVRQTNNADFDNLGNCNLESSIQIRLCGGVNANTGDNEANRNTAEAADPSVTTGDVNASVDISNMANVNSVNGDLDLPSFPGLHLGGLHLSFSFDLNDLLAALGV